MTISVRVRLSDESKHRVVVDPLGDGRQRLGAQDAEGASVVAVERFEPNLASSRRCHLTSPDRSRRQRRRPGSHRGLLSCDRSSARRRHRGSCCTWRIRPARGGHRSWGLERTLRLSARRCLRCSVKLEDPALPRQSRSGASTAGRSRRAPPASGAPTVCGIIGRSVS